jgi:hypothetical protein
LCRPRSYLTLLEFTTFAGIAQLVEQLICNQ